MTDPELEAWVAEQRAANEEIGRELRVSELQPKTIVWVAKGRKFATMWVVNVGEIYVKFWLGAYNHGFLAKRVGERITDDTGKKMWIYEYLGEP